VEVVEDEPSTLNDGVRAAISEVEPEHYQASAQSPEN
jgi:hypothetical protein